MKKTKTVDLVIGKDTKDIPETIRIMRESQGITQEDMYIRTGILQRSISMYETYKRGISDKKLQLIIDGLDAELIARFSMEQENEMTGQVHVISTCAELIKSIRYNELCGDEAINIRVKSEGNEITLENIDKEIKVLEKLKNIDVDEYGEMPILDSNGILMNTIVDQDYYIKIGTSLDINNISDMKEQFIRTKRYLERSVNLRMERDRLRDLRGEGRNKIGNVSYSWCYSMSRCSETLYVTIDNDLEIKKNSFIFNSVDDVNEFTLKVVDWIEKNLIFEDSDNILSRIRDSIFESVNITEKLMEYKKKVHLLSYERPENILEELTNYIFYMATETIELGFQRRFIYIKRISKQA